MALQPAEQGHLTVTNDACRSSQSVVDSSVLELFRVAQLQLGDCPRLMHVNSTWPLAHLSSCKAWEANKARLGVPDF
jgi:hypothetical protein